MVLDPGVKALDSLHTDLRTAIDRALTLEPWVSRSREWITTEQFIRRHTEFDSVNEFLAACPCEDDTLGAVRRLPTDQRDAFVARTTDFETWRELKQTAAIEDLIRLQNV